MKKLILIILCFASFNIKAQNSNQLTTYYSPEELVNLEKNNSEEYQFLVYAFENACVILDMPKGKEAKVTSSIDIKDLSNYNYLELGLDILEANQYFRINSTDKMLLVKSRFSLQNEMKK